VALAYKQIATYGSGWVTIICEAVCVMKSKVTSKRRRGDVEYVA
jgi:hypothetical protein